MIPKHIFFTHEDKSKIIDNILKEWKHHNPDFTFHFFNSDQRATFIKKHYPEFMKYYISTNKQYGALRADIWRYLVIYHYGGVYIDHKVRILKPISSTLDLNAEMCVTYKGSKRSLYTKIKNLFAHEELVQYCFAAEKNSKHLKQVIDLMLDRLKQQSYFVGKPCRYFLYPGTGNSGVYGVFYTTGPLMFTDALKNDFDSIKLYNNEFYGMIEYPLLKTCSLGNDSCWYYIALHMSAKSYHFCTEKIFIHSPNVNV